MGANCPETLGPLPEEGDYSLAIQTRNFKRINSEKQSRQHEALKFAGP